MRGDTPATHGTDCRAKSLASPHCRGSMSITFGTQSAGVLAIRSTSRAVSAKTRDECVRKCDLHNVMKDSAETPTAHPASSTGYRTRLGSPRGASRVVLATLSRPSSRSQPIRVAKATKQPADCVLAPTDINGFSCRTCHLRLPFAILQLPAKSAVRPTSTIGLDSSEFRQ
jgi:hypothetical protein